MAILPLPPSGSLPPVVRRLGLRDEGRIGRWLATHPAEFSFVAGWLHSHGVLPTALEERFEFLGVGEGDALEAVALTIGGAFTALATHDPVVARAFAAHQRRDGAVARAVQGPRPAVNAYVEEHQATGPALRVVAVPQHIRLLQSRDLRYVPCPGLRLATVFDAEDLLQASLAMHAEELGERIPEREVDAYRAGLVQQIAAERMWCLRDPIDGRLQFKVAIAASAPQVALVEGIYTAPGCRRRGIARAATAELARLLLSRHEQVALHARDENAAATRLYGTLGFRTVAESMLVLLRADGGSGGGGVTWG
ncbi:MAG: GNAT family N-acetyltransferase [Deltaproteobacteria bacterium]|nr:MAG: GNAT family N-acetyltransferase [Deltaproteobacteria bacterium]